MGKIDSIQKINILPEIIGMEPSTMSIGTSVPSSDSKGAGWRRLRATMALSPFEEKAPIENPSPTVLVQSVKRHIDLDNQIFKFEVVLENGHAFDVDASFEDLTNQKIFVGMPWTLVSETFDPDHPGTSFFVYEDESKYFHATKQFASIHSHWQPGPQSIVTVQNVEHRRTGMSFHFWVVSFSDRSTLPFESPYRIPFSPGEEWVKVSRVIFVNPATGRVIEWTGWNSYIENYIPVTWKSSE